MEFTVKIENGNVYINGKIIGQCCWEGYAIGNAIAEWFDSGWED